MSHKVELVYCRPCKLLFYSNVLSVFVQLIVSIESIVLACEVNSFQELAGSTFCLHCAFPAMSVFYSPCVSVAIESLWQLGLNQARKQKDCRLCLLLHLAQVRGFAKRNQFSVQWYFRRPEASRACELASPNSGEKQAFRVDYLCCEAVPVFFRSFPRSLNSRRLRPGLGSWKNPDSLTRFSGLHVKEAFDILVVFWGPTGKVLRQNKPHGLLNVVVFALNPFLLCPVTLKQMRVGETTTSFCSSLLDENCGIPASRALEKFCLREIPNKV